MSTIDPVGEQQVNKRMPAVHPSTLVIGLGNPILGDDGVGWRVVEELAFRLNESQEEPFEVINFPVNFSKPKVEMDCLAVGGLALMERIIGYDRVVIIDSMITGQYPIGSIKSFSIADTDIIEAFTGHLTSSHDTSFSNALRVGREMGAKIPGNISILGIEINPSLDFSEELSPQIFTSIKVTCELAMELIK